MKYLLHTECPTSRLTKVKGGIPDIRRGIYVTIDTNLIIVKALVRNASIACTVHHPRISLEMVHTSFLIAYKSKS